MSQEIISGVAEALKRNNANVERQIAELKHQVKQDFTSILARDWSADLVKDWREQRSYRPGDLVRFKGGVWQAWTDTSESPLNIESGWVCLQRGIDDVAVKFDGEREVDFTVGFSDGTSKTYGLTVPVPVHTGKWDAVKSYGLADEVAWGGSTWRSTAAENKTEPGTEGHKWLLVAQKGSTGKIGPQGEKGDVGPRGPSGRDASADEVAAVLRSTIISALERRLHADDLPQDETEELAELIISMKAPRGEKGDQGDAGRDADPEVVANIVVAKYRESIEAYIDEVKQAVLKGAEDLPVIDGDRIPMVFRGEWESGARYERGDVVSIRGLGLFQALQSTVIDPRSDSNNEWVAIHVFTGTGGGTFNVSFLSLVDTPDSYLGQAGKIVKVKADETGVEFGTANLFILSFPPAAPVNGDAYFDDTLGQVFVYNAALAAWVGV